MSASTPAGVEIVLGVRELTLSVMDGNTRAMRFYERLGMRPYLTTMVGPVPGEPDQA